MNDVYLVTNIVNDKKYVGITCRGYMVRFKEHIDEALDGSTVIFHNAIRKYGPENFKVELLETDVSDKDIEDKERYYIKKYNTFYISGSGYNMTEGGGGMTGYKHTTLAKKKIHNSLLGHIFPKSRNEKIKQAMLGREYKPEWKRALSESRKGRFTGTDNPFYGKHHSDVTKKLISDRNSKYTILQLDLTTYQILHEFKNLNDAGRWVVANNLSKADYTTCALRIGEVCRNSNVSCTAYGYHWKHGEDQSTKCKVEDELPSEAQPTVDATVKI